MSDGLDVIIVDDDPSVCELLFRLVKSFYIWGEVISFTDVDKAVAYCLNRETGIAIFIVDVFLGGKSGFSFLDAIAEKFVSAHNDSIIISGKASDDVVNMCVASGINYLLEKPIRSYALQLAVRAIMNKYLRFARKLLQDPLFAMSVSRF
ncbi:MAG: response regulator [Pseudomonadota bacterium]|uniref:Response regulator n=1 Tax=Candidatus Desulfatibia profunda TaxID=2841695 RepID=A0A8J6NP90_9BACT|nr:response regulator [Candidatus Desulfatibia profunda]MBL7180440.1 response regulator [Desulfobacterales bacterium]